MITSGYRIPIPCQVLPCSSTCTTTRNPGCKSLVAGAAPSLCVAVRAAPALRSSSPLHFASTSLLLSRNLGRYLMSSRLQNSLLLCPESPFPGLSCVLFTVISETLGGPHCRGRWRGTWHSHPPGIQLALLPLSHHNPHCWQCQASGGCGGSWGGDSSLGVAAGCPRCHLFGVGGGGAVLRGVFGFAGFHSAVLSSLVSSSSSSSSSSNTTGSIQLSPLPHPPASYCSSPPPPRRQAKVPRATPHQYLS